VPFRIAFERVGAQSDIWLVYSDGTGEQPLTSTATQEASPAWSPDASTIVYACAPSNRNWDLCSINVDTREVTQLTKTPTDEFDPQFTPESSQIVFETYPTHRNADLAIMSADGGDATPLTSTPRVNEQDPSPDPNSSLVAFSANGSIETLDTKSPDQITKVTPGNSDSDPSFSTNGDIAFRRFSGRTYDLFTATGGSDGTTEPTTSGKADDLQPAFTGDGAQLAFVRRTDPSSGFQIFAMTAQGQDQQPVTKASAAYDDVQPAPEPPGAAAARAWSAFPAANLAASCKINGTGSGETINGTTKRNCINAKGGNDKVNAKGGNDRVDGGSGRDTLNGNSGNDFFVADDGEHDVIDGGSGANDGVFDPGDTLSNVP
jgi:Tol biopolymer transport system component